MEEELNRYQTKKRKIATKVVEGREVGRGDTKRIVPEEEVAKLASYHCTEREIADFFDLPLQTLKDNFQNIIDKNRMLTKHKLRKAQIDLALRGDKTMLIWLGKNILGQSDNPMAGEDNQILPWTSGDTNHEDNGS